MENWWDRKLEKCHFLKNYNLLRVNGHDALQILRTRKAFWMWAHLDGERLEEVVTFNLWPMIFFLFQPSSIKLQFSISKLFVQHYKWPGVTQDGVVSHSSGVGSSNTPSPVLLQKPKMTASTDSRAGNQGQSLDNLGHEQGSDWSNSCLAGQHLSVFSVK